MKGALYPRTSEEKCHSLSFFLNLLEPKGWMLFGLFLAFLEVTGEAPADSLLLPK